MSKQVSINFKSHMSPEAKLLLEELKAHLGNPRLVEHVREFLHGFLDGLDLASELFTFEVNDHITRTGDLVISLEPTNCLRMLMVALRAGYIDGLSVENIHE